MTLPESLNPGSFIIALPPLTRATAAHCSNSPSDSTSSTTSCSLRNGFDQGLAYAEVTVERQLPTAPNQDATLTVEFEPLPLNERLARESFLFTVLYKQTSPDSTLWRRMINRSEAQTWYAPVETTLAHLFGAPPPPDFQLRELTSLPLELDVVVVPNQGGWGNVPLEKTGDLLPNVIGLRQLLAEQGLKSVAVPFYRTTGANPNYFATLTELFGFHHTVAQDLAGEIARLLKCHPRIKVIMIGLSNGATIADAAMNLLPAAVRDNVYAIELGTPFWRHLTRSDNILHILGSGADPLANGDADILLANLLQGVVRITIARLNGLRPRFEEVFHLPGHFYTWENIRPRVADFLDRRLRH
ncbi:MAG: hypothetical protein ABIK44_02760 [candidate division WOR-3 bacterium]